MTENLPMLMVLDKPTSMALVGQVVNFLIVFLLFAFAAHAILKRGKGWEVPVWLVLSLLIPVIFPVIALIHFRKSKSDDPDTAK